ncbi:MAG: helix-turn-helix domain-containing protein [Bacteroidetes bacterium]|nr:helix-turn-helix domain-containing protein [Bacteroidota bacterium]
MNQLYLIGFAQALFFTLLILTKKNKILSDYVLAFFIFLLGGQLFFIYSYYGGLYEQYPSIIIIDIYYWVLLGPTLLLYTYLMSRNKLPGKIFLLSFIPLIIITIGAYKYIFIDGSNFFSTPSESLFEEVSGYIWLYNTPLFFLFTIFLLKKHSFRIKDYFSSEKNVNLKWVYFLTSGFAIFLLVLLFGRYLDNLIGLVLPRGYSYIWLVMVLYIFGIGVYGYRQRGIFVNFDIDEVLKQPGEKQPSISGRIKPLEKTHYEKSGLSKEEAEEILNLVQNKMAEEKFYIDCEINLSELAKEVGTTTHKLSQVINEKTNKNFFEFINEYRIDEVKAQLLDPAKNNLKIISIAYDCGFNSKSAFYTLFKKHTGITPAEYRQTNQKAAV